MKRWVTVIILAALVPIGISTKLYRGPLWEWVNQYAGDIVSPVFIFFLVILILPRLAPPTCAAWVFLFCIVVELSQFLSGPLLESARRSFIGRTILGSKFDALDFLFYVIGLLIALGLHRLLRKAHEGPHGDGGASTSRIIPA